MTPDKITTHVDDALNRRVEQHKEKENLEGMLKAFNNQKQELENVFFELLEERLDLNNTVGQQLDNFGKIVDLEREGFDDDFYRILLLVKIGQNVSNGDPERIISTFKLLTQATLVHYQNLGDASIGLSVDTTIDPSLVDFFFENMERVVAGGVRIDFMASFDPDESFSFDGVGPIGLGFSSLAAPTTGGKFAYLNRRSLPFAFAGDDKSALGFGTVIDPVAGGVFVGL